MNPAVDGNGISPEEFAEDPDFEESYFAGVYDVSCYECGGLRVVSVLDDERCDPILAEMYAEQEAEMAALRAEEEMERRMGA